MYFVILVAKNGPDNLLHLVLRELGLVHSDVLSLFESLGEGHTHSSISANFSIKVLERFGGNLCLWVDLINDFADQN
jgi:hypothetical protein